MDIESLKPTALLSYLNENLEIESDKAQFLIERGKSNLEELYLIIFIIWVRKLYKIEPYNYSSLERFLYEYYDISRPTWYRIKDKIIVHVALFGDQWKGGFSISGTVCELLLTVLNFLITECESETEAYLELKKFWFFLNRCQSQPITTKLVELYKNMRVAVGYLIDIDEYEKLSPENYRKLEQACFPTAYAKVVFNHNIEPSQKNDLNYGEDEIEVFKDLSCHIDDFDCENEIVFEDNISASTDITEYAEGSIASSQFNSEETITKDTESKCRESNLESDESISLEDDKHLTSNVALPSAWTKFGLKSNISIAMLKSTKVEKCFHIVKKMSLSEIVLLQDVLSNLQREANEIKLETNRSR